MPKPVQRLIPAYGRWIIRWRLPVLMVCLLAAVTAASALRHLEFTSDFRVFFGPENPELLAYNALEATYTKTDNILFVIQPKMGDVFNAKTLEIVKRLTEASWRIPHAIRVDSITNFQHIEAKGDDLSVADLIGGAKGLSDTRLAKIRFVALSEPALVNRLIAANARTTGVLVTLQFPGTDHTEHLPNSVGRAEEMVAGLRAAHPDVTFALTGLAVLSNTEAQISELELRTLVPIMYLIIIVLLLVLLRSVAGTIATLVVVSLSVATAMGLSAWLGMRMNPASATAPVIILTLAVANCVHILLTGFEEMRAGRSKDDALVESLRINAQPVFLTTLTTMIGFLSLNFSDAPPFQDLGNVAAMGVFAAWGFAMTVFPALISLLPLRTRGRPAGPSRFMETLGNIVVSKRIALLWSTGAITLFLVAFIPRIEIDDRFVRWFDESIPFRADTDFATANLVGPYSLEFSIDSGAPGGIAEPAYLDRLEAFVTWLRAQPEVTHVNSLTDVMKRLNKSMHGDSGQFYRLPKDRNLAAQYLLVYEMSLPQGLDLNSQISIDKSASRLTATLKTIPTREMRAIAARAESWLQDNAAGTLKAQASGATIMFAYLTDRNIRSMLSGTALAFLLIALTLIVALRSIRLGLVSLISNFLPVLIAFGLWAIFVGELGIIASVVTATTLGIIVDDTMHILSKYNRARRERGLNSHNSVRFSFSRVGTALWMTTVVLVAGFAVLGFSDFKINADTGIFTAVALLAALAVDFLLLPPLLMLMDKDETCDCVTCVQQPATLSVE